MGYGPKSAVTEGGGGDSVICEEVEDGLAVCEEGIEETVRINMVERLNREKGKVKCNLHRKGLRSLGGGCSVT